MIFSLIYLKATHLLTYLVIKELVFQQNLRTALMGLIGTEAVVSPALMDKSGTEANAHVPMAHFGTEAVVSPVLAEKHGMEVNAYALMAHIGMEASVSPALTIKNGMLKPRNVFVPVAFLVMFGIKSIMSVNVKTANIA